MHQLDDLFTGYRAKHPALPERARKRMHDRRVIQKRLTQIGVSEDALMDGFASGQHGLAPGKLRRHSAMTPPAYLFPVPSLKEKLERSRDANREIDEQLAAVAEGELLSSHNDMEYLFEYLAQQGWRRIA